LSFSSLRADTLTPELLASLTRSRHQAVAIAPDAGSERLRRVINKGLSTEQILNAAEILVEAGVMQLKLYFMIGLPTETLDDLQALAGLTKKIKHHKL
ncbi:MAG TPA: radical SAM protein, partial [Syntrophobacteraceae bacterium]|nr:radical SAM protein [Syntrophobacteraceae bacterium]